MASGSCSSAHALAAHGRPRATQDLDVLVAPTAVNARKLTAALADFGVANFATDWRWFTKPYRVTMLGRIPLRIDVLTAAAVADRRRRSQLTS